MSSMLSRLSRSRAARSPSRSASATPARRLPDRDGCLPGPRSRLHVRVNRVSASLVGGNARNGLAEPASERNAVARGGGEISCRMMAFWLIVRLERHRPARYSALQPCAPRQRRQQEQDNKSRNDRQHSPVYLRAAMKPGCRKSPCRSAQNAPARTYEPRCQPPSDDPCARDPLPTAAPRHCIITPL